MSVWYQNQVIYQIYPKSFNDSNHDGIGDINGITEKIPYLKKLGVTTLWLNPIYVSPQVDNGYDVADYYQVDPTLGTLADVQKLIKTLHANGMYLIFDFVLNHTSDQHPWFQKAIHDSKSKYRDYYLWADPNDQTGDVPNNWGSFFGGSVWELDPIRRQQYYFHLFDKRMPDLNWKNPDVRAEMLKVAQYWVDQGIDGLRLDAFIHLGKADFRQYYPGQQNPVVAEPFFAHLPAVQTYLREFCQVLKKHKPDLFIVGEAASADVSQSVAYTLPENHECDSVITFRAFADDESQVNPNFDATFQPKGLDMMGYKQNVASIEGVLASVSQPILYWSNHDMARILNRYGDLKHPTQSAKALATLLYLQKGIPIIYYGEELGLQNIKFDNPSDFDDATVSPFIRSAEKAGISHATAMQMLNQTHKMAARGPMQWNNLKYHGFSTVKPWKYGVTDENSVANEETDETSVLSFYQELLRLKQTKLFQDGTFIMMPAATNVFAYRRETDQQQATILVNASAQNAAMSLKGIQSAKTALQVGNPVIQSDQVKLDAWSALVLITDK